MDQSTMSLNEKQQEKQREKQREKRREKQRLYRQRKREERSLIKAGELVDKRHFFLEINGVIQLQIFDPLIRMMIEEWHNPRKTRSFKEILRLRLVSSSFNHGIMIVLASLEKPLLYFRNPIPKGYCLIHRTTSFRDHQYNLCRKRSKEDPYRNHELPFKIQMLAIRNGSSSMEAFLRKKSFFRSMESIFLRKYKPFQMRELKEKFDNHRQIIEEYLRLMDYYMTPTRFFRIELPSKKKTLQKHLPFLRF